MARALGKTCVSRLALLAGFAFLLTFLLDRRGRASLLSEASCSRGCSCPSLVRSSTLLQNLTEFFEVFGGDERRYSYHSYLNRHSIVVEVGGYTGVDIAALRTMYGSFRAILFEPIFHEEAVHNMKSMDSVTILPYGVGAVDRFIHFDVAGDATRPAIAEKGKKAEIRNFKHAIDDLHLERVDLLQINCEGCEWELLETILDLPRIFEHIQVQFHPDATWVDNQLGRYAIIQDRLAESYDLVYDQTWIWQLWRLKRKRLFSMY